MALWAPPDVWASRAIAMVLVVAWTILLLRHWRQRFDPGADARLRGQFAAGRSISGHAARGASDPQVPLFRQAVLNIGSQGVAIASRNAVRSVRWDEIWRMDGRSGGGFPLIRIRSASSHP